MYQKNSQHLLEVVISHVTPDDKREFVRETINLPIGATTGQYNLGNNPRDLAMRMTKLLHLMIAKGFKYRDSWKKRGEIRGIISNIDRKDDRLEAAIDNNDHQAKCDGAADGAVYRLLYVFDYLQEHYPKEFGEWWQTEVVKFLDQADKAIIEYNILNADNSSQ